VKVLSILVALAATGALAGQEAGTELNARVLVFTDAIRPSSVTVPVVNTGTYKDHPDYQGGVGVRVLGELPGLVPWNYELAGRYDSTSHFATKDASLDLSGIKFTYRYFSVGGAYLMPVGKDKDLTFGMHGEIRSEYVQLKGNYSSNGVSGGVNVSEIYLRPWVRVSIDKTWKLGTVNPLAGLDAGLPLLRTSQQNLSPSMWDSRTARSMAPRWDVSVYAGVQF